MSIQNPKLHAFIAQAGVTSRRKAELLIAQGKVSVNGTVVRNVAHRINTALDTVSVRGKKIDSSIRKYVVYMINKPRGYVSTTTDPDGKKTVLDLVKVKTRIYPIGRLDEDSEGLLLLTNNGALTYALIHPKHAIDKTYRVLVQGSPTNTQLDSLKKGIQLKNFITSPEKVWICKHEQGNTWLSFTMLGGKHRQIRRMCGVVGLQVLRLVCVAIGSLQLGTLPKGKFRRITSEELADLYSEKI